MTEELRLDSAAAEFVFVLVGRDGRIVLGERYEHEVRTYGANGALVGRTGRKGQGPGEFQDMSLVFGGWKGDTAWAYDMALRRFTTVSNTGSFLRTWMLPGGAFPHAGNRTVNTKMILQFRPLALFADGGILGLARYGSLTPEPGGERGDLMQVFQEQAYIRADSLGTILATLAVIPETQRTVELVKRPVFAEAIIPLLAYEHTSAAPRGDRLAIAVPTSQTDFRLVVIRANGDTAFSRRLTFAPTQVTSKDRDSVIRVNMRGYDVARSRELPASVPAKAEQVMRERMPSVFPAVTSVMVGMDSTVWLALHPTTAGQPWLGLDARGADVGTLVLPRGVRLRAIQRDRLWALASDKDGVSIVRRYRIEP